MSFVVGERVIYWPTVAVDPEYQRRKGDEVELVGREAGGWLVRFTPPILGEDDPVVLGEHRFKKIEEVDSL